MSSSNSSSSAKSAGSSSSQPQMVAKYTFDPNTTAWPERLLPISKGEVVDLLRDSGHGWALIKKLQHGESYRNYGKPKATRLRPLRLPQAKTGREGHEIFGPHELHKERSQRKKTNVTSNATSKKITSRTFGAATSRPHYPKTASRWSWNRATKLFCWRNWGRGWSIAENQSADVGYLRSTAYQDAPWSKHQNELWHGGSSLNDKKKLKLSKSKKFLFNQSLKMFTGVTSSSPSSDSDKRSSKTDSDDSIFSSEYFENESFQHDSRIFART